MNAHAAARSFVQNTDALAQKHRMKVSVQVPGHKEVVIADHTGDSPEQAQLMLDLEELIKTNVDNLEKAGDKIKKLTEMVNSALMNDEGYRTALEAAKKATKERNLIRYQILQKPENKKLAQELTSLKADKKEAVIALSDYLREYKRISKGTQLELFDGRVMEIVEIHKLVPASKK